MIMVVDSSTGKIVGGPEIHTRGSGIDDAAFSTDVLPKLVDALARSASDGVTDTHALASFPRVIGKWVSDNYRRRPMIIPVVVEV